MVLRGDRAALSEIRFSEEFERIIIRATVVVDSVGVVPAYAGQALAQRMALGQEAAAELGG
jgi:hypothetical protein